MPRHGAFSTVSRFLRSQKTGVVSAFTAAALLGAGSIWMSLFPALYKGLGMDDIRFLFSPWRVEHAWFYALVTALTVWALSTLWCTASTLRARLRLGVRRPSAYGTSIIHVAFLLALVAHLQGGLGSETHRHVVGPQGVEIAGARYRTVALDEERYPTGMPRVVTATFERTRGNTTETVTAGYNRPIVLDAGRRILLLGRYAQVASAVIHHRGERVTLPPGRPVKVGEDVLTLGRVFERASLRVPVAQLSIEGPNRFRGMLPLTREPDPSRTAFVDIVRSPMVALTERHIPGILLVGMTALLLLLGVAFVAWERLRVARTRD